MEELIQYLIYLHIAAGTVALITGPVSMANRKGGKQHRLTGKIFFVAMLVVSATAVTVAATPTRNNPFLLIVGVFSAYLVSSGYRVLYLKGLAKGQKASLLDWAISFVMAVFAVYFVYSGVSTLNSNGIIPMVFGSIALLLVLKDIRKYTKAPADQNFWLYDHITRMIAGNIAAFTAFLVVNNTILPPVVAWLAPTVIGTIMISYNIRKYKLKNKGSKAAKASAIAQAVAVKNYL